MMGAIMPLPEEPLLESAPLAWKLASELCGKDHAFMPIQVRVVSPEAYQAWLEQAKTEFPAS